MEIQSIFANERDLVRKAMELLASGAVAENQWPALYEQLLKGYAKLLRQTERLVRISDMMQNQLSVLNAQLDHHRRVAEEANKAKSQFLAMMGHDIRNPMAAVVVMTDLLMDTRLSAEQIEYLTDIKTASGSLVRLLDELLDLSRIEAGKLDLVCTDFGLWDCIGDALRTAAVASHAKDIEICSFIDRNVPFRCIGDCGRLGQILMNLLSNAVKFTERGQIVTRAEVTSRERGELTVHFSVADSGIGIPKDRIDSVFEEFEQADRQIMDRYGGSGLGLAICSRIVKGMGGKIWAESEEGKGSTFHCTVRMAEAPEWTGDAAHDQFERLKDLRVLILSPVSGCRAILEEFLRNWTMRPTSASDGESALDILKEAHVQGRPFEVILVDGSLPELNDLEAARSILQSQEVSAARVILLAKLDRASPMAEQWGVAHRLSKPPRLLDLLTAMAHVQEKATDQVVRHPSSSEHADHDDVKLNILVAEDNPINRILAMRMLEKMGQKVSAVEDGNAVLQSLAEHDYDLVLMDVEMPQRNGVETAKAIRESERGTSKHVTIIATTAHVRSEDRQRFLDAGMDACVSKPIDWTELMELVRTIR